MKKRLIRIIFAVVFITGMLPLTGKADIDSCTTYNGSNIEYQNYTVKSSVITSYLTNTKDNQLMRVQYGAYMDIGGILVEYYDSSYQLEKTTIIPEELPIFGGFYETDTNYFILTGQTNYEESAETEVFRITKYDKNWNRIASVGLYDCNTTVPFKAGSARMDTYGKYLFIRTCHEMYTAEDGLNHQANVTIQMDMEKMEITDSYTRVMNNSYGYVSHSFNQFIKVEDGHIIAVDHGDAYPRSIVLTKYRTDASDGTFVPGYYDSCMTKDILGFPGVTGNNYTGASAGGFEISDTSYLFAGNSVVQDEKNMDRTTRNIFTASIDKETLDTELYWLTSYEEGDGTVSTPQMVKIDGNRFLVLWSRENEVYYTEIDSSGKPEGDICHMEGCLSDCVPIVFHNKLIWYTWNQEKVTFYEIDVNDDTNTQKTEIVSGHDFQYSNTVDGMVYLVCSKCGEKKQQIAAEEVYGQYRINGFMWISSLPDSLMVGDEVEYKLYCYPYDSDDDLEILIGDVAIIENSANTDKTGTLKALKRGKTTITVRSRWNPDVCMEYSIMIKDETEEGLYGDANGDGEVNSKDAILMKKYLAGYEGLNIDMDAADVNVDGNIDSKDVVRLLRYLAGYQVTLGK